MDCFGFKGAAVQLLWEQQPNVWGWIVASCQIDCADSVASTEVPGQCQTEGPYYLSNNQLPPTSCLIYATFLQLNKEFSAVQKLGRNLCSQTGTAAVQLKVERRILYKTSDHVTKELIVDLAFPGTARTIQRILDAYWQAKVSFCPSWLIFHKSSCWTPNLMAAFLDTKSEFCAPCRAVNQARQKLEQPRRHLMLAPCRSPGALVSCCSCSTKHSFFKPCVNSGE